VVYAEGLSCVLVLRLLLKLASLRNRSGCSFGSPRVGTTRSDICVCVPTWFGVCFTVSVPCGIFRAHISLSQSTLTADHPLGKWSTRRGSAYFLLGARWFHEPASVPHGTFPRSSVRHNFGNFCSSDLRPLPARRRASSTSSFINIKMPLGL